MSAVRTTDRTNPDIDPRLAESTVENQEAGLLNTGWSTSLIELICAAAINQGFCDTLLVEPDKALVSGFNGQRFFVTDQEYIWIKSVRAASLPEFIHQLKEKTPIS